MRLYIEEKVKSTTKHFKFGNVPVIQKSDMEVDFSPVFKAVEKAFPSSYFSSLKGVEIAHREEFDVRNISALYRDGVLFITDKQDDLADLLDDLIHEMAHHIETTHSEEIYGDGEIEKEFLKKRKEIEFELKSEGYWTQEYDFTNTSYDKEFDNFLYRRVGGNMLKLITSGVFVRPYGAVSIREYFATGFEAYYLEKKEKLYEISPVLYNKIDKIHNL